MFIPNGAIVEDDTCVGGEGNKCDYVCDEGYKPKSTKTYVTCTSELDDEMIGQLKWDMTDPCEGRKS